MRNTPSTQPGASRERTDQSGDSGDASASHREVQALEKYELLEEIGHGGMATVYRARDTRLDREVAVKVLHPHLRGAGEARSRFAREAKSVARLRHPNILEVYDYSGEESEECYIASELLTGPTLKRYAESLDHPMPAEVAACFVLGIVRALGEAHAHGIIHRDVKPENVLLHEDRCVKLTDFGIAQMVDSQSFTATGQILGSPGHMAPEQVEGGECDARTDLFSIGTVLYYLAVGRLPFQGKNPHQVLKRIVDADYADPLRVQPSIGGQLKSIIDKALARDPAERYQSAEELETDLLRFVEQVGISDPDRTLCDYLDDREQVEAALREATIARLTELGEQAADSGDVPAALDHFNRVLALDEGNQRVLQLIDRVGRRGERRRRTVLLAGVALGVVGLGLGGLGYAVSQGESDDAGGKEPGRVAGVAAGTPAAAADGGAAAGGTSRDGGHADAAADDEGTRAATEGTPAVRPRPGRDRPRGPRTVVFRPTPQNVRISVDGSEPRPFGPSFRKLELEPGRHTFKFIDGAGCCKDAEFTVRIPPGPGKTVLDKRLEFQPAGLYVVTSTPAEVRVGEDGRVRGRAREVIRVPMDKLEEVVTVSVTADGYQDYTTAVRLRAGDLAKVDVEMEASESGP